MIALEIHIHMDIDSHMEMQRLYEYVLCNLVVRCVDSHININMEIHIHIAIDIHSGYERWGAGVEYHFQEI